MRVATLCSEVSVFICVKLYAPPARYVLDIYVPHVNVVFPDFLQV